MKLVNTVRLIGALSAGVLLSLFGANAFAAPTAGGTSIGNSAIVSYSVNSVAQYTICSGTGNGGGTGNSTSTGSISTSLSQCATGGGTGATAGSSTAFLVDNKVIFTVTTVDAAVVPVTPGTSNQVLVYKVTNSGNTAMGFTFTTTQETTGTVNPFSLPAGATDGWDPTGIQVFVSKNNSTTYNSGNDLANSISSLAGNGATQYVFIVSSVPLTAQDGQLAVEALVGTEVLPSAAGTYNTGVGTSITDATGTAWSNSTMQNLFMDAAGTDDGTTDGKSSSRDAYIAKSSLLNITKTASVISDGTSNSIKHAIPGAVMQYTITVANTGSSAATGVTLSDSIATQVTAGSIAYKTGSVTLTDPNVSGGATQTCVDTGSTFGSDSCAFSTGTNTLSAVIATLSGGQTATVTFQVTIQ